MTHIYMFTNSPGEVFSWVKPMTESLVRIMSDVKISIFLTPCQYASGQEKRVCLNFPNVEQVFLPKQTLLYSFFKQPNFPPGFVFYLGGNPSYPQRFAQKTGSKLLGYAERKFFDEQFDLVVYQSRINNLMVSNLSITPVNKKAGICLLPGSRPEHLAVALPFMVDIVAKLRDIPISIMLSPFTSDDVVASVQNSYPKLTIIRMESANDLSSFKYALTIPGTNTMQLAYFNIPFLMILPTHQSKILRLDGLLGLFLMIPFLGPMLKFVFLRLMERTKRIYALPNQLLGSEVCPELVGRFSIETAQDKLHQLISEHHRYLEILQQFKTIKQSSNVASYFSEWVSRNR